MTTTTVTCQTCLDTGWDELFGSACGDCGYDLATPEAIEQAKADREAAQARLADIAKADMELADWLKAQTWSEFAQSLAKAFATKGVLTIKQRAAAEKMRAKVTGGAQQVRWTKYQDNWVLIGPPNLMQVNTTVTVHKANGDTTQVQLGAGPAMPLGDRVMLAPAPRGAVDTKVVNGPGMYVLDDGRVVKVQKARGKEHLYTKVHDPATGRFEYLAGGLRRIVRRLTLEEATAYGQLTGICMVCGAELTNEDSIERGIGPICAGKL